MTRHGVVGYWILPAMLLVLLLGFCSQLQPTQDRQIVMDTDQCLRANKRAVMMCNTGTGECRVQCREKTND